MAQMSSKQASFNELLKNLSKQPQAASVIQLRNEVAKNQYSGIPQPTPYTGSGSFTKISYTGRENQNNGGLKFSQYANSKTPGGMRPTLNYDRQSNNQIQQIGYDSKSGSTKMIKTNNQQTTAKTPNSKIMAVGQNTHKILSNAQKAQQKALIHLYQNKQTMPKNQRIINDAKREQTPGTSTTFRINQASQQQFKNFDHQTYKQINVNAQGSRPMLNTQRDSKGQIGEHLSNSKGKLNTQRSSKRAHLDAKGQNQSENSNYPSTFRNQLLPQRNMLSNQQMATKDLKNQNHQRDQHDKGNESFSFAEQLNDHVPIAAGIRQSEGLEQHPNINPQSKSINQKIQTRTHGSDALLDGTGSNQEKENSNSQAPYNYTQIKKIDLSKEQPKKAVAFSSTYQHKQSNELRESDKAKKGIHENKNIQNAIQRNINSVERLPQNSSKGQVVKKTMSQYLQNGQPKSYNTSISPLTGTRREIANEGHEGNAVGQASRPPDPRIQRAHKTEVPPMRIMSQDKLTNKRILSQDKQPLHGKGLTEAQQRQNSLQNLNKRDLLNSGVNRRIEGINYNQNGQQNRSQQRQQYNISNLRINNMKDKDPNVDFNSMDSADANMSGSPDMGDVEEVDRDLMDQQNSRNKRENVASMYRNISQNQQKSQQLAHYMKNTISRQNQVLSRGNNKEIYQSSNIIGGVNSSIQSPIPAQNTANPASSKRTKSAYHAAGNLNSNGNCGSSMTIGRSDDQNQNPGQNQYVSELKSNAQVGGNLSILSYENSKRPKQKTENQKLNPNAFAQTQNVRNIIHQVNSNINVPHQPLSVAAASPDRRDRQQRIQERTNPDTKGEDDQNTDNEMNDTQVISIGLDGPTVVDMQTENNLPADGHQSPYPQNNIGIKEPHSANITNAQKKKLLYASVASVDALNQQQMNSNQLQQFQHQQTSENENFQQTHRSRIPTPRVMEDMKRNNMMHLGQTQKMQAPSSIFRPTVSSNNKTINFIQRNIKRAGQSKEKYSKPQNSHSYSRQVMSPKPKVNIREGQTGINSNIGLNSMGSVGSLRSPMSPAVQNYNTTLNRKNQRKPKTLREQPSGQYILDSSNLHGQTGTTVAMGVASVTETNTQGARYVLDSYQSKAKLDYNTQQHKLVSADQQELRRRQNFAVTKERVINSNSKSSTQLQSYQKSKGMKAPRFAPAGDSNNLADNDISSMLSGENTMRDKSQNILQSKIIQGYQTTVDHHPPKSPKQIQSIKSPPQNFQPQARNGQNIQNMKGSYLSNVSGKIETPHSRGKPQSDHQMFQYQPKPIEQNNKGQYEVDMNDLNDMDIKDQDQIDINVPNINQGPFPKFAGQRQQKQSVSHKSNPSGQSGMSKERFKDIQRHNDQIRQLDMLNQQQKEQELQTMNKEALDALNRSTEVKNQLREQLNNKGYQIELASQGSEDDIDKSNSDIDIPNYDSYKNISNNVNAKPQGKNELNNPYSFAYKAKEGENEKEQTRRHQQDEQNNEDESGDSNQVDADEDTNNPQSVEYQQDANSNIHRSPKQDQRPIENERKRLQNRRQQIQNGDTDIEQMSNQLDRSMSEAQQQALNDSQITTQSELNRYAAFSQHLSPGGMICATIYHIRKVGQNIYNPQEREMYYSDDFLINQRHINDKVEQELEDFKIEINEKVEQNTTKNFVFPRPGGEKIYLNTDSNVLDASHRSSVYHQLPTYEKDSPWREIPAKHIQVQSRDKLKEANAGGSFQVKKPVKQGQELQTPISTNKSKTPAANARQQINNSKSLQKHAYAQGISAQKNQNTIGQQKAIQQRTMQSNQGAYQKRTVGSKDIQYEERQSQRSPMTKASMGNRMAQKDQQQKQPVRGQPIDFYSKHQQPDNVQQIEDTEILMMDSNYNS